MPADWDPSSGESYVDFLLRNWPTPAAAPAAAPPAAPAAAPAGPPPLETDPAFAAFQRAVGFQRSSAERSTNDQVDTINRTTSTRLADIADEGGRARRGIEDNMDVRGLYRSGETERRLGEQRADEGRQVSALQSGSANQIAALRAALGQQMAGFDTQLAERSLEASERRQADQAQRDLAKSFRETPLPAAGSPFGQFDINTLLGVRPGGFSLPALNIRF